MKKRTKVLSFLTFPVLGSMSALVIASCAKVESADRKNFNASLEEITKINLENSKKEAYIEYLSFLDKSIKQKSYTIDSALEIKMKAVTKDTGDFKDNKAKAAILNFFYSQMDISNKKWTENKENFDNLLKPVHELLHTEQYANSFNELVSAGFWMLNSNYSYWKDINAQDKEDRKLFEEGNEFHMYVNGLKVMDLLFIPNLNGLDFSSITNSPSSVVNFFSGIANSLKGSINIESFIENEEQKELLKSVTEFLKKVATPNSEYSYDGSAASEEEARNWVKADLEKIVRKIEDFNRKGTDRCV